MVAVHGRQCRDDQAIAAWIRVKITLLWSEAPKFKVPLNGTHNRMFLMDFSMQRWRNKGAWTKPCMGLFFKLIVIE
jgi:hypothetical protein